MVTFDPIFWESSESVSWESGEDVTWQPVSGGSSPFTTAELLNLTGVSVRADGFFFELLDQNHNVIGPLQVDYDNAPRVRNDTTRSVFRTCTGLTILDGGDSSEFVRLADINVPRSRVRPSMILQNGATFPLGVFMFGDDTRAPFSWGTRWTPELFDETFIVDQPLDLTYGLAPGDSILSLINLLVGQCNLPDVDFSAIVDEHASSAVTYAAGSSRNQAVIALFATLGCLPPYFDNSGTYTAKPAPAAGASADHTYASGGTIIDGTVQTTNSIYRAPNQYQVIGSDPSGAFIGVYDLPDSAANSYAATGVRVTTSQSMQGIPSVDVANLAAYILALTDQNNYVQASFQSTADPRHESYDLVDLLGVTLFEASWEIECSSGGPMTHSLVGFYSR